MHLPAVVVVAVVPAVVAAAAAAAAVDDTTTLSVIQTATTIRYMTVTRCGPDLTACPVSAPLSRGTHYAVPTVSVSVSVSVSTTEDSVSAAVLSVPTTAPSDGVPVYTVSPPSNHTLNAATNTPVYRPASVPSNMPPVHVAAAGSISTSAVAAVIAVAAALSIVC